MDNHLGRAIYNFFSPQTIFPFVIGSIFLNVLGNSATQILNAIFGTSIWSIIGIIIFAFIIFFTSVTFLANQLKQRNSRVLPEKKPPQQHKFLILLVSKEAPCLRAIEYHKPTLRKCWLICSNETQAIAEKIRDSFPSIEFEIPSPIKDIYDPLPYYACVNKIYNECLKVGLDIEDIIADFTGMTAQGSVGMVLAGRSYNSHLQYIPYDTNNKVSLEPIEIELIGT